MRKVVYFDMDGTLCDFYGVSGWLDYLIWFPINVGNSQTPNQAEEQFNEKQRLHITAKQKCHQKNHKYEAAEQMVSLKVVSESSHFQIGLQMSIRKDDFGTV